MSGEIVGVGLATRAGNYYLPVGHRFEESGRLRPDQLPLDVVVRELRLADLPLIAHNAKFEFRVAPPARRRRLHRSSGTR